MIAAALQSMAFGKLPFNWFDAAVVLILAVGLLCGRKNGMTKEVLPVVQWLSLVLVCGLGYETAAQFLINSAALSKTTSCVLGYLILALLVLLLFVILKRILVPRLTGSNVFGDSEYYLGMISGMIRFACMLLAVLALLNARVYTQAELQAHQSYERRWYGGGLYSGNYMPDLHTVQEQVFGKSYTGHYITNYFGALLINTAPPPAKEPRPKPAAHP